MVAAEDGALRERLVGAAPASYADGVTTEGPDRSARHYTPRNVHIVGRQELNSRAAWGGGHPVGSPMWYLHYLGYLQEIESALRATLAQAAEDALRRQATAPTLHGADEPVHTAAYVEEARRLADALAALITLVRECLAQALGLRDYAYVDTVPRHDRSPCGVVRLTTPTIPRAPGQPNSPSITTRWGVSAARPLGEARAA